MSKLFVDEIVHQSSQGSGTITLGASGEKIDLGATAGGTLSNKPNFFAYLNADQTISTATSTKVNINTEVYDTEGIYDNSTNYRATIPTGYGGKWCFYYNLIGVAGTNNLNEFQGYIRKNGSILTQTFCTPDVNELNAMALHESIIVDCSAGDYFEVWGYVNDLSGSPHFRGESSIYRTYFGGYRLIGA